MGTDNVDMLGFRMFGWDAKDAVVDLTPQTGGTGKRNKPAIPVEDAKKISLKPAPMFSLRKTPKDKVKNLQEADRLARLEELKLAYSSNPAFEIEPTDYVGFATELAKAYRNHTTDKKNPKGLIPTFLLDEDTIFQVEEEGAEVNNLGDLL